MMKARQENKTGKREREGGLGQSRGSDFKSTGQVGGRIGMGNTCKSMADSCQCMAKTTTIL